MKLADYVEPLAYDVASAAAVFAQDDTDPRSMGDLSMYLHRKFRALGIVLLIVRGDADLFHHNLIRSALARVRYLSVTAERGLLDDHHRAAGRIGPLMDALAARQRAVASEIAGLVPTAWMPDDEYEDDHCYSRIVGELVSPRRHPPTLAALFTRYEDWLDGASNARLDATRAIARSDQLAFDDAIEGLVRERLDRIAADIARNELEEPTVVAERQVFVEGLALLFLAEASGLRPQATVLMCPSLARTPMRRPFPGE
jgi:hypothetical protein